MRLIGGVLLVVLLCAAEARSHEVCEDVCRGLHCDEFHTECNQAESLFGCKCDGCANCRPEGRRLEAANSTAANSTAPGCAQPCFGDARGCDAFIPLGATCVDLETNEYLQVAMATCDCSGCLLCDEIDAFGPAVDACAGGDGGAVSEISTEAAMTAALAAGAPCTSMVLTGDVALGAAAYFESSVRLVGAAGASRPVLSPASGPHRLVTIVDQAVVSLASVVLRDGYEVSAGGCVFVGGGSKLSLDRVAFENCAAGTVGGGVAGWTSSLLHVARSSFDNNAAGLLGGSVFGHDLAAVVLTGGTRIGRSSAFIGGGVAVVTAARVEMSEESRIEACFGSSSSGGLFAGRGALATLSSGSVIAASHTAGNGGGFFSYISSTVVLEGGCTVANCTSINAGGGGQAYVADVFTASDCTFIGCLAMAGGAGLIVRMTEGYGSGTITNIDFFHCTAPRGSGGGFSLGFASRATLTDLRFVGCTAGQAGGAVAAPYSGIGAMVLLRTSITRCHADGDGGALFLGADFRASIDASTLSDNTAGGDGGAVAAGATSKLAVFGGTRVERNSAGNRGGGLALLPASIAGVQNAVVADNSAFGGGGAVFVGAGATLHLGRAALLSRNVAGSDGGAVDVRGKDALLYVSTSCSFVEVTLDWTLTNSLDAADASVLLDYAGARDARGAPARFVPQNGAVTHFEACLPPGRGYELWAASSRGQTWLQGSWSIKLPPHGGTVASFLEPRLTFVQAVNEYGVQGIGSQTHGALAAAFHLDDDDASFDAAVDGIDAVRIVGNVALAGGGGGVSATKAGRAVVYEALFEANHALTGSGGAFAVGAQSTAVLQSVNAVANVAGRDGGAVRVGMLGVVDIYNSTATANDAGGRGGFAILDRVRTASLRSVTARGNRAADRGGALSLELCDQDPVVVAHSTFQNNSAALSGGALDVQSSFLRVEGATLFAGNSVDAGSGGGVAVRPTGAALALASQPAACVAVLRVVVDWRHNAQRCEVVGAIFGTTHNLDGTCDSVPSSCDPLRTIASATRCAGCTCKENLVGAGESYFSVDRVADGALLPTEAATLFVGEPDAGAAKEFEICLEAGEYKIVAHDRRGAAWFGGTLEATVLDFELEPIHRASAEWSPSGFSTEPVRFSVRAVSSKDLAVRFVDNAAIEGGGAAVFWTAEAPAGLEAAATYSTGNAAGYGSFAATPATQLLINTTQLLINSTLTKANAVPSAAMPPIETVLVDGYGQVVSADSTTAVNVQFIDDALGVVQASGLVAVCAHGVARFDAITIIGLPGDTHRLHFMAPSAALETAPLTVDLTPCPVGFAERADGDAGVSCIACSYMEFYDGGYCVACPRGAACERHEPLNALSAQVGYQLFTLETLPIKRGFYRFFATSDKIYKCPDNDFCEAGHCSCAGVGYEEAFRDPSRTHGSGLCATNSEGPLCALCGAGYHPRPSSLGSGGGCAKCESNSVLPIFFAGVFAALIGALALASAAAVACAGVAITQNRILRAASFVRSRWFIIAVVQVWYAVSTVVRFTAIEEASYPEPLQSVLQFLGFFSFDLSFVMPSLQCFYHMTYFELFLTWSLFPLAFGAFLGVGVVAVAAARVRGPPWPVEVWRQLTRTVAGRATRRTAVSLFWLVLVLLHTYICSIIFTFYSCSEAFAVSETEREQWLAYDYGVRCGSEAHIAFEGAAATLLVLYVLVVPASLALKLKLNRRAGRSDGALAFFTRHVRPAVWYYEIVALEVRLVVCGALVPVTSRGLRLSIILVVIFGWTIVTREMRPYINRGHQVLVNYLQIFVLSCLALALILYGELLSDRAAKIFAWIVSAISIFITVRLYSAYKSEEVTEIVELVRSRRAFDRNAFLRLHVGMNVRVMDHAVFAAALAILDDEFLETTAKAPQAAGAAAVPGWAYLTAHLLPLRDVWTRAARKRTVLLTHAPRLLENAALLVRTRVRCAPEAGGVVMSERKFAKAVDSVLGPLAQELCGDVVAETFSRFAAAEPQPTLALDDFEAALRAILDHTSEQEEQDLDASLRCGGRASVPASLRGLALAVLPAKKFAPCKKYDAENQDSEDDSPGGARAAVGAWAAVEERASRMLLRLRPTGRHATRGSPHKETPQARSAADVGPAPGEACRRHNDKFFDLAVHAHAANFKCWMVMEEAAAAILAEPDWGARISALADFSDGPDALLQTPLQDPRLVAWVAGLGGDALREHFDEAVLPHALRSVALDAHPAFIAALRALMCVPEADDDAEDEKEEEARALWTTKVELYKFCSATAVKSATRMSAKVEVYRGEDGPASASWPRAARITDPLRATVVCDDAEAIVRAYDALRGGGADGTGVHLEHGGGADDTAANAHPFRVTRLKNKLGLCTKPFNLHINCVFDRGDGAAPITTEIQIVPRAVNAVTGPSHKFYTLSRALKAEALV